MSYINYKSIRTTFATHLVVETQATISPTAAHRAQKTDIYVFSCLFIIIYFTVNPT